ncbi:1,4-dihydroxy-2-naphthoate octaprenyltransferase [unidentified eubacterium SCB49]|nr:1,4-dihydroxy-2-naphthoate octaprenyltransferase [unidentified eubacterium SCB49]
MQKVKAWISAARLRTLPLSISGIIVGTSLGNFQVSNALQEVYDADHGTICFAFSSVWRSPIFWLAILVTIGFQVLSNFANDYGDGVKGTDANREGEKRMVASGVITPSQMKVGMIITGLITLFLASLLIFIAFGNEHFILAFIFFNLAIAAIIAAVKYTVGTNAYGYSGFGDVFVYLFFGLLSVLGSYFMFVKSLELELLLPATAIGLFSVAVLNLNNMRDIYNDAKVGKNTLVVKFGMKKAKRYHYALIVIGMVSAIAYTLLNYHSPYQFIYTVAFIPLLLNCIKVSKNSEPRLLDSELKKVALSTFAFAILFAFLN